MKFLVLDKLPTKPLMEDTAYLIPKEWDDYGFETRFNVHVALTDGEVHRMGTVAILPREYADGGELVKYRTTDKLPTKFRYLEPSDYCSLGQDADYYERLGRLSGERGRLILEAINDVCFTTHDDWWSTTVGYEYSLLRYNNAHLALRDARELFDGNKVEEDVHNSFTVKLWKQTNRSRQQPLAFKFSFDGRLEVPGRLNVIVGKNGCGKTTLLVELAEWFSKDFRNDQESYRPEFASVLVVTFNPFDQALVLNDTTHNVQFVGRQPISFDARRLLDEVQRGVIDEIALAKDPNKIRALCDVVRSFSGTSSYIKDMEDLRTDGDWLDFVSGAFESDEISALLKESPARAIAEMSAGQRVLTQLYAALFARLDRQSLVLLDEPENHLHPSLLARFIRKFNELLEFRRAFAIVATHSPIVLQETPARFVTILEREGDSATIRSPDFETFGESTDGICDRLFQTDFKSSNWKRVLRTFAAEGLDLEAAEKKISGMELPLYARTYFAFHQDSKENK